MNYTEFLNQIIDRGIVAANADYTRESQKEQLAGAVDGFQACRNLQPQELLDLFQISGKYVAEAMGDQHEKYWYFRCYQLEVEWVINVVSAMLYNEGHQPLMSHLPTCNAMMMAAKILGVGDTIK